MKHVHWTASAVADLERFRADDEEFGQGTPQIVIDRIVLATDWLLEWPYAGRAVGESGWRKWKPRRTAHVLIYRPVSGGIEIGRVRHERENWLSDL